MLAVVGSIERVAIAVQERTRRRPDSIDRNRSGHSRTRATAAGGRGSHPALRL